MRTPIFYPYKIVSAGARRLARILKTYCVYPDGKYVPRPSHVIITWGSAAWPSWKRQVKDGVSWLNLPVFVNTAINKLRTFETLDRLGVRVPKWTTNRAEAVDWTKKGRLIVCRKSLTGSGGYGIILNDGREKLPDCHLYTRHIRHSDEYRVHVFDGKPIDIAEKRKRRDFGERDILEAKIRSWDNGWVFCHEDVKAPAEVVDLAISAVKGLELDFGAVDIGYRVGDRKAYVFEVNTAPGIEGQTLKNYANAIRAYCNKDS